MSGPRAPGDLLTQAEVDALFTNAGPGGVHDSSLWISGDGELATRAALPAGAHDAWRAALGRGEADTAGLEWRRWDHGVTRRDAARQARRMAEALAMVGAQVRAGPDGRGHTYRITTPDGGEAAGQVGAARTPDDPELYRNGEPLPRNYLRFQAAAVAMGLPPARAARLDALHFAAAHGVTPCIADPDHPDGDTGDPGLKPAPDLAGLIGGMGPDVMERLHRGLYIVAAAGGRTVAVAPLRSPAAAEVVYDGFDTDAARARIVEATEEDHRLRQGAPAADAPPAGPAMDVPC